MLFTFLDSALLPQLSNGLYGEGGDGMSEAIAFIAGLFAMMVVWFINDNSPSTSPYRRGFEDGYRKAMKDYEQNEVTE